MIRILQVVSNMDRAGIESMLMNYYRHIDRTKIQFDFLCNKKKNGAFDDEIRAMGGRIFYTPGLNPFKYGQYLTFFKKFAVAHPEYKIIHAHNDAFVFYSLFAAKCSGIPVRISHVHCALFPFDLKWPLKIICRALIKYACTDRWACGQKAGQYFYSKKENFHIHHNAIDLEKFIFNNAVRQKFRKKYQLDDSLVIGHVGRFTKVKNHDFLIRIFREIYKMDHRAKLVLLGEGPEMESIRIRVRSYGLEDCVLFMGLVENTYDWYQVFDLFILPSISEGLPVVGIEAQTADLPCVFSENVTKEVKILPTCLFLSREKSPTEWAESCLNLIKSQSVRINRYKEISHAGYDINKETINLMKFYQSKMEKIS